MAAFLEVDQLVVELPTRKGILRALDHVSFSIEAGEIVGMVGESGAGKSLLGAAIIGLLAPPLHIAGGSIRFAGARIDNLNKRQWQTLRGKRIAAILQDPLSALNPLYTVGQQLIETLQRHCALKRHAATARAIQLLHDVGITEAEARLHHYPHQFSGGQRQRIVIAMALAGEPELLIADEPTTALDVVLQAQIISLLKDLCTQRGTAVLLITHDMGVVAQACDRLAVLYAGRLVEVGTVDAVIQHSAHPYTQGLMRCISDRHTEHAQLPPIDGVMPRLGAIPRGCAFHPRCPQAMPQCTSANPALHTCAYTQAACWQAAPAQGAKAP